MAKPPFHFDTFILDTEMRWRIFNLLLTISFQVKFDLIKIFKESLLLICDKHLGLKGQ